MLPQTATPPAIEVRDLVKRYPKAVANAVDGVSFSVARGEIFGLLGPNGAGKTTTIGTLIASVKPSAGRVAVMGYDVARDPVRVKQRIAVVPQRPNLDQSLRVREILTFHGAYHGMPARERNARADALLDEMGLGGRKRDKVSAYSGGMAQRLMIARALVHAPDALFLDEPTNNLDPQSRLFLWERIRAHSARGLTILLTTHDMEEADQLCQRIAIMDRGKILVNDTPAALKLLIPGGNALELRVHAPEMVMAGAASVAAGEPYEGLLEALRQLPGVTKADHVESGEAGDNAAERGVAAYRVYAPDAGALVGSVAQVALARGAEVRDLRVKRPSLEDVFIYLTGRQMR
jgi:ABC-2 type transport system ATP-binding protein